jgi:hypothetical protein
VTRTSPEDNFDTHFGPQRSDFAVVQNTALQGKLRIDSTYGYKEIEVQIIGRLGADSEEKHEPVSDIDTIAVDSLKALDPERPIREAGQPHSFSPCQISHMFSTHHVVILIQHYWIYCETNAAIIQKVT